MFKGFLNPSTVSTPTMQTRSGKILTRPPPPPIDDQHFPFPACGKYGSSSMGKFASSSPTPYNFEVPAIIHNLHENFSPSPGTKSAEVNGIVVRSGACVNACGVIGADVPAGSGSSAPCGEFGAFMLAQSNLSASASPSVLDCNLATQTSPAWSSLFKRKPSNAGSGFLRGKAGHCNTEHDSDCCRTDKLYPQYRCSPRVTSHTRAKMTINSFAKGGDGGGPSECDNSYHSDEELVVALSTGWYNKGKRCSKNIRINANGRSVLAKVVDECDSVEGCDADHDFQPPCPNNDVDASPAVWKALKIPQEEVGELEITWSDA